MPASTLATTTRLTRVVPRTPEVLMVDVGEAMTWPLDDVRRRVMKEEGWTEEVAALVEREYRRFMWLCATYKKVGFPPSRMVDKMWHAHILHTPNYRWFCNSIAGEFIDHCPSLTADDTRDNRRKYSGNTLRLYRQHFGEPVASVWPQRLRRQTDDGCVDERADTCNRMAAADCTDCGDCGDCG